jgi:hypothetical protein
MLEAQGCLCRRTPTEACWSIRKRNLGCRRFYALENIVRSAHVIPTGGEHETFYINNYIDWDQYNTLYDPDFIRNRDRLAKKLGKGLQTEMMKEKR